MANFGPQPVEFGPFSLDRVERVLRREGQPVPLRPKDFDMLLVLVGNSGRVVEKEELLKQVWPDSFVEEANLSHHIFTLRKALGDGEEEARYIETVPRRGYRFVAPVTGVSEAVSISHDERSDRPTRIRRWQKAIVAAVLIGAAGAAVFSGWQLEPGPSTPITRSVITLGQGDVFTDGPGTALALSPDGTQLAYTAESRLYVRALERLDAVALPGIERPGLASPRVPFFSPDGRWVGFWEERQIKKVSIRGGAPMSLCDVGPPPQGATWAADGSILIGHGSRGVWRVSADGGTCEPIITVTDGERVHGPQLLPDGKHVLFTLSRGANWDDANIVVQSLATGTRQVIVGGTDGRYLTTGHLVYALRDTVLGVQFDPIDLRMTGIPVPLVEGVRRRGNAIASAQFAVSSSGVMAYVESKKQPSARRTLVWVDRQGREEPIPAGERAFIYPRMSPDGNRLALDIQDESRDIWVWDFSRRMLTLITTDPARDEDPVWSRDGRRLIFLSLRTGAGNLFWQPADGSGTAERLTDALRIRGPDAATPDGKWLVVRESDGKGTFDLALLELPDKPGMKPASSETKPLVPSSFAESNAEVSPDGRWLTYQSNNSGSLEVYLRPFPNPAVGQWQVSRGGGTEPLWSRDSRELFYRSASGAVMRVPIDPRSPTPPGAPIQLFNGPSYVVGGSGPFAGLRRRTYDVSLDGRRFLMITGDNSQTTNASPERIVLVQNWFEELKAKLPK
jgi:serine/threonine-protein kinase